MVYENIQIITEAEDKTTNETIEWLLGYKIDFNRKNVNKSTNCSIYLSTENTAINVGDEKSCKVVWNRRGKLQLSSQMVRKSSYSNYLIKETFSILAFLEHHWKKDNLLLGSYMEESLNNKTLNLRVAKEVGLQIPDTIITNNKKDLLEFYRANNSVISKCMVLDPLLNAESHYYAMPGTFIVNKEEIESLEDSFAPSFVQKYIEKKYEVRVFVTGNSFFAMAIFSQNDEQTKVDFRNYNRAKPNRNIPFELPTDIKEKIKLFLLKKEMNQGSIDFIVTPENEFVFLEINPQGQLDWVSKNCNYYIEKHIAEQLINHDIQVA